MMAILVEVLLLLMIMAMMAASDDDPSAKSYRCCFALHAHLNSNHPYTTFSINIAWHAAAAAAANAHSIFRYRAREAT